MKKEDILKEVVLSAIGIGVTVIGSIITNKINDYKIKKNPDLKPVTSMNEGDLKRIISDVIANEDEA